MLELAILACLAAHPGTCTTRTIDATDMGLHGCVKVRCGRRQFEKEA